MKKIAVIVPAYNEQPAIAGTLKALRRYLNSERINADIVVVDDGSSDKTGAAAEKYCDYLLTHTRNCGLGAALATGIEFARRGGYHSCITFDSDGQHDVKDILLALSRLEEGYDVVIGSRFVGTHSRMPRSRRIVLALSNIITLLFFGVRSTDSQSGFRALSKRAIDSIELKSNRMEVSSEFFGEISRLRLNYTEIPIHITYTDYSLSKGQSNSNSLNVLIKLIYKVLG